MGLITFLFLAAPPAGMVAMIALIFGGNIISWFFGSYGVLIIIGALMTLFGDGGKKARDISADINEQSYQIRSIFGEAAQREFLGSVAVDAAPGKNDNSRKFAPGQNHKTMTEKSKEIRGKYKPVEQWKPRFDPFGLLDDKK